MPFGVEIVEDDSRKECECSSGPVPQKGEQGRACSHYCAHDDELSAFLLLVESDNHYRVDEVMKKSASEVTEKVTFVADNHVERGPYIRKYLKSGPGVGLAYAAIHQAQERGAYLPHLPRIYAVYQLKDELVVVMEYLQGETLQDVVLRCGPSFQLAQEVFPQVCEAVRELHERFNPSLIHRDLKPANIVLSNGKVFLIDFGIARVYRNGGTADTSHLGTRAYAPPEQYGFGQTDARSDVYALGMVLFYCLTGRTAEVADRESAFAHPLVPGEYRSIIERACAFDPCNRYGSVEDLQRAFALATDRQVCDFGDVIEAVESKASKLEPCWLRGKRIASGGGVLSSLVQRIPIPLGLAWNTLLCIAWLFVVAVSVGNCLWPSSDIPETGYPLWFRVVEYFVFLTPASACVAYELSDRRSLWRKYPMLRRLPLYAEVPIVGIAIPFFLAVVMTLLSGIAGV